MAKRGPKPKVCENLARGMAESYRRGASVLDIALDADLAYATVWEWLQRLGVEMRPAGRRPMRQPSGGRA